MIDKDKTIGIDSNGKKVKDDKKKKGTRIVPYVITKGDK